MSNLERKIVVTGDSRGAESTFDKMSDSAVDSFSRILDKTKEVQDGVSSLSGGTVDQLRNLDSETSSLFKSILKESEKYSKDVKERSRFLDREISQYERINKEEKKRYDIQARMRYEERTKDLGSSPDDVIEKQQAKKEYNKEQSANETRARMAQLQVEELRRKKAEYDGVIDDNEDREDHDDRRGGDKDGGAEHDKDNHGEYGIVGKALHGAQHLGHSVVHGAAGALGFGAMFSIGGIVHKLMHEGEELDKALVRADTMGLKSGSVVGLKTADAINYSKSVAQASWTGDVRKTATEQAKIERGTGLELGTMNQFHNVMNSEQGKTLNQATLEMLGIMKKSGLYGIDKGDFSMMHKLLEVQNALSETQANQMEEISSATSSQLMSAFGQVGGSFSDQRQAKTITGINQSIVNPNNDFTKAFIMRSIKSRDPDASLLDVMMSQEEGIFKEGQFKGIMEDLSKTFSGDQLVFSASKALGLNLHQSKKLVESYEADPEQFNKIGSKDDIESFTTKDLKSGVSGMEQITAKMDDKLSKYGVKAVHKVEEMINALETGGIGSMASKGMKDLVSMMAEGFTKGASVMKDAIIGATDAVFDKIGEKYGLHTKELTEDQVISENEKARGILINSALSSSFNEKDADEFNSILEAVSNNAYKPDSDKSGEDIAENILDDNEWIRSGFSLAHRHGKQERGKDVTDEFMQKHVKGNMENYLPPDSFQMEVNRKYLEKQADDNPSGVRKAVEEYEKTGTTTNKILLEILDLQKTVRERNTNGTKVDNYSTTTVE